MDKTEINLKIAGIKGIEVKEVNGIVLIWVNADMFAPIDYLSPELNHALVVELLDAGWRSARLDGNGLYRWISPDKSAVNKDFDTATCLAYIEAMK